MKSTTSLLQYEKLINSIQQIITSINIVDLKQQKESFLKKCSMESYKSSNTIQLPIDETLKEINSFIALKEEEKNQVVELVNVSKQLHYICQHTLMYIYWEITHLQKLHNFVIDEHVTNIRSQYQKQITDRTKIYDQKLIQYLKMKESGNCVTSQQQHIKENIETFKLSLNPSFYYDDNSKQDVKSPKPKKKQNREPISKRISGVYQHFPIPDNDQMPLLTENTSHEKICSTKNVISNTYDSQFGILKNICSFDSNEYSISKDQISTLLTWTKCSNLKIFFDTKECGWNRDSLNNALLNKLNIVLLHYTTDNDIFGVYIHNNIKQTDEWVNDENHFIFSFSNNNRSLTPKRWKCSTPLHSIYLSSKGTHFYQLGNGLLGSFIKIQSTQSYNESFIATGIYSHYFGLSDEILTGNSGTFTINRIVVMQLID